MQMLFYISLAVTVMGLILAVVIFFLYDIPMIYAIRSGKQEQKAVARLNSRSSRVGNFGGKRPGKAASPGAFQSKSGNSGGITGGTSKELRRKIKKLRVEQNSDELNRPPVLQETEMLGVDSLSRMAVQDAAPKADTMPLRVEAPEPAPQPSAETAVTVDLSGAAARSAPAAPVRPVPELPPDFFFQVVEDIVVCDTEERI